MKRKFIALLIPLGILFWVSNASRPGSQVEGCLVGCSNSKTVYDGVLRVVSLNILHGYPEFEYLSNRLEIVADGINNLDVDIILLQEIPWTLKTGNSAKFIADRTGMNYAYLRANGNRWEIFFEEGEAILSRYPIIEPTHIELKPRSGFFEHRVALGITAVTDIGNVDFYVTHLTDDDAIINRGQLESLIAFIDSKDSEFVLIAGDFNAQPESQQIRVAGLKWVDTFTLTHPNDDGYTCCIDDLLQIEAKLSKRIDYIFMKPGTLVPSVRAVERIFTKPINIEGGWLWASDHVGLMVDLEGAP